MTREEYLKSLGFKNKYPNKYGVYELKNNGINYIIYYLKNRKDYAVYSLNNIDLKLEIEALNNLKIVFDKFIELKNN